MARLLSPSDYGTVTMVTIFYAISRAFIDSGFANALIRKLDRTEEDFSTVFIFNVVISIIIYLLLFSCASVIASFFHTPILRGIIRVQSISLVFYAFSAVLIAKLTIDLDFKAIAIRDASSALLSGLIGVLLAYKGFGVWAIVFQGVLGNGINLLFVWVYCKWRPRLTFSWLSFKSLFSYGSKLLMAGLLNTLYSNLTPMIIGKHFSAQDLGYYSRGVHFASYPVGTINSILQKVTFPIFSQIQENQDHLTSVYRKNICISSLFIFFGCALMAALGKPIIHLLLTEKWSDSIIYLQIFCFAIMFDHISSINLNLLQVKGRSDLFLKLEVIKKTIAISMLFASIPFGVIGICVSKVIYSQIAIVINTYYTGKLFHMNYFSQIKDFSPFFISSLLSCIPAYFLTFTHLPNVLILCFGGLLSVSIYLLLLRNNNTMKEVIGTVRDLAFKKNSNINN